MNILFIAPADPAILSSGRDQRSHLIHKLLSEFATVYTFVPVGYRNPEFVDWDRRVFGVRQTSLGKWKYWMNRAVGYLCPMIVPFPISSKEKILECTNGLIFDYVVVRYAYWAAMFAAWEIAPLIVDVDDLPTEVYESTIQNNGSFLSRLRLHLINRWMYSIFRKSVQVWLVNKSHVSSVEHVSKRWIPNLPLPVQESYEELMGDGGLLSVGQMGHFANSDGITYFLTNLWLQIHHRFPQLRYKIVGGGIDRANRKYWESFPNVDVLGFVEDIKPFYRESLCAIAPIYSGGGTCIKVLEALGYGRGCFVTPCSARGLDLSTPGIIVFEAADDILSRLLLLQNFEFRRDMQRRSVSFIAGEYSLTSQRARLRSCFSCG